MKQIFLKVLKDGTTTSNVSSLIFDGENLTTKVSIDYSGVGFSDWIKQADIFVGQTRETDYEYTNEVGNVLEFYLEEGHLVKGYLRIQPLVKRLEEGSIYSKQKWETVELKVKKSLNVLEDDISITQSIAEQWEIRIQAVEDEEVIRQENENIRIDNENTRISQENARNVFENYNPLTAYVVGNKVSYNGSSYVCILDSTGNLPTDSTYWLLIAQKGDNTTASAVTNTPSGNISATTVQGAINELDTEKAPTIHTHDDRYYTETEVDTALANKADKLFATNLVTNGDFSNGTTGWSGLTSNVQITNGKMIINTSSPISPLNMMNIVNANRYYLAVKVKSDGVGRVNISFANGGTVVSNTLQTSVTLINFDIQSLVLIATGNGDRLAMTRLSFTNNTVELDDFMVINLTEIFGVGKEPTKEQMDWLLAQKFTNSWFNGTAELTSITDLLTLVNTKANIAQEAWITPTLLNGATHDGKTFMYRKNDFGMVEFKGRLTNITNATVVFRVNAGYRPPVNLRFQIDGGGALSACNIDGLGDFRFTTGSGSRTMDSISYYPD